MKTGDKIGTTPKGNIGEEPSWICKKLHMTWHTYLCCLKVTIMLPNQAEKCHHYLEKFERSFLSGSVMKALVGTTHSASIIHVKKKMAGGGGICL